MEPLYEYCRSCGGCVHTEQLSKRGFCYSCGKKRVLAAISAMRARKGHVWDKWKANYIASLPGVIERLEEDV